MDLKEASTEDLKAELACREVTITFQRPEFDLLMRLAKEPLLQFIEAQKGKTERPAGLDGLMQRLVLAMYKPEDGQGLLASLAK